MYIYIYIYIYIYYIILYYTFPIKRNGTGTLEITENKKT